jgi:DNA processing protein
MTTTTQATQPDAEFRAKLLRGLVNPHTMENEAWLAHTWAAVVWSQLTEPGDELAGVITGALGMARSLDLVVNGTADEIRAALTEATGMTMVEPESVDRSLKAWRPRWSMTLLLETVKRARDQGIQIVTSWDEQWPEGFDRLGPGAPHVLWVRGNVDCLTLPSVAYVGARAASSYGEHVAMELASASSTSHVIVSGGAYGIDGAAHRAALSAGGKTIAYMAGGVDRPYPVGHAHLLERIVVTGGAMVSEVPPGSAPTKWRFLSRNRLIAAHAEATIVVEAGSRSGSINTAGHAVALGRPLGAVPGPITSATSTGCHRIIQELGGELITSAADVEKLLAS